MKLSDFIHTHKPIVEAQIEQAFTGHAEYLEVNDHFGLCERMLHFSMRGKMLRGLFVVMFEQMYNGNGNSDDAYKAAAAIEILQSGILTQDDIMDNDLLRRGDKTIYAQFADDGISKHVAIPEDYGKSQGMMAGDFGIALAGLLLSQLSCDPSKIVQILQEFHMLFQRVIFGQMIDFDFGTVPLEPSEAEILHMYSLKTSAYTFELPLMVGAILGGASHDEIAKIKSMTPLLGQVFQIKDDELGILGDSLKTGKAVGADISENKKTLIRARLLAAVSSEDSKKLATFFGKKDITPHDVQEVQNMIIKTGVKDEIDLLVTKMSQEVYTSIEGLAISDDNKELLRELVEYNASRTA